MFPVIDAYHSAILFGVAPKTTGLVGLTVVVVLLLILGRWMFQRLERDIRDLI
jgi:ABC-type polysaccharide/polyol phosphate export permease